LSPFKTQPFFSRNLAPTEDLDWKTRSASDFLSYKAGPTSPAESASDAPSFLSLWSAGESLTSPQKQQQHPFETNLNLINSLNNNKQRGINNNNLFDHERNNSVEPLKILTNEFAENLGLHSKDFDSGYLSPNNTNGYHLPGKPGLNRNIFTSGDAPPKLSFGFGDESSSFLPYVGSRSSPDPLPYDSNISPPPMDFRSSGFVRYPGSSASSVRASRPNSQDFDAMLVQHKSGYASGLVGAMNSATTR
jgi:hypothetical protein